MLNINKNNKHKGEGHVQSLGLSGASFPYELCNSDTQLKEGARVSTRFFNLKIRMIARVIIAIKCEVQGLTCQKNDKSHNFIKLQVRCALKLLANCIAMSESFFM